MTSTEKGDYWLERIFKPRPREEIIQEIPAGLLTVFFCFTLLGLYGLFISWETLNDMDMVSGEVESAEIVEYWERRSSNHRIDIWFAGHTRPVPYPRGNYKYLSRIRAKLYYSKHCTYYFRIDLIDKYTGSGISIEAVQLEVDGEILFSFEEWRKSQRETAILFLGIGIVILFIRWLFLRRERYSHLWDRWKWKDKNQPRDLVDVFTHAFRDYPPKRLREIAEGEGRQPEAKEAARQLLAKDGGTP